MEVNFDNRITDIVCLLWGGDRWNLTELELDYVNRLFYGCSRNLRAYPFRFTLLLDIRNPATGKLSRALDDGISIKPLIPLSWLGCLPKLSVYDPGYGFHNQVLMMDLDTVVTGDLTDIVSYRGDWCTRLRFKPHSKRSEFDGDTISFNPNAPMIKGMWEYYKNNVKAVEIFTEGRERFFYRKYFEIETIDFWQDLFPGQYVSYKWHVRNKKEPPANARLVSCHGRPRPHQIKDEFIVDNWIPC
jgi:hypothetical protein